MSERFYTGRDAATFTDEAEDAGFIVEHYQGYSFYEGPGVRIAGDRELVDLIRVTTPDISWDTLGRGYIVYPVRGDEGTPNPSWVDPEDEDEW